MLPACRRLATLTALMAGMSCSPLSKPIADSRIGQQAGVAEDALILDALLAQVSAPGGCRRLDAPASIRSEFLPGVRLLVGRCESEHGLIATPIVAVDSAGVLFQLGTVSGLNFLLRRHPLQESPVAAPVSYGVMALKLSGLVRWDQRTMERLQDAPAGARASFDSLGIVNPTRVVDPRPRLVVVDIGMASADRVDMFRLVILPDGQFTASPMIVWRKQDAN